MNIRFYLSYDPKTALNQVLARKRLDLDIYMRRYYSRQYITLQKSVNHLWFIDFNAWGYSTLRRDVI